MTHNPVIMTSLGRRPHVQRILQNPRYYHHLSLRTHLQLSCQSSRQTLAALQTKFGSALSPTSRDLALNTLKVSRP